MEKFVIMVAGGSGSRMQSDIPKQFIPLSGKPVLMHTLEAFHRYSDRLSVRLVLPEDQFGLWDRLCSRHRFAAEVQVVAGGATRFHSVRNGLESITADQGLVAVHDGVRPFVPAPVIAESFAKAAEYGSAVTCVKLKDSLRRWETDDRHQAVDREHFRLIQTPQTFRLDWMRAAFSTGYLPHFTDCASVMEQAGFPVHLIEGAYQNIKLTTPEDLLWAEAHLRDPGNG